MKSVLMTRIPLWAAAALLAFLISANAVAHDGPHGGPDEIAFRPGKNGDINLRQDLKFGTVLVKRGKYVFDHRLEAGRHVIVLTEVPRKDGLAAVVYELPTQLLAARRVTKRTALYAKELADRSLVVTMVEVAGEQSEHLPLT